MKENIKFNYKDDDKEGIETLSVIANADYFNRWMYETIKPYCKGNILEIGSGLGNISSFFINDGATIFLTDIRDNYCKILQQKFNNKINLLGVQNIDLVDQDFDHKYAKHFNQFDTVFALNVVEHIENDNLAIINCKKLLKEKGNLIILVPAYQALYNQFDKELYHYKRYVTKEISQLLIKNKLTVVKSFYFNALGIAGWFVSGKLAKNKTIPGNQMNFYNKIVFLAKFIDFLVFKKIGLSAVVIGKKN